MEILTFDKFFEKYGGAEFFLSNLIYKPSLLGCWRRHYLNCGDKYIEGDGVVFPVCERKRFGISSCSTLSGYELWFSDFYSLIGREDSLPVLCKILSEYLTRHNCDMFELKNFEESEADYLRDNLFIPFGYFFIPYYARKHYFIDLRGIDFDYYKNSIANVRYIKQCEHNIDKYGVGLEKYCGDNFLEGVEIAKRISLNSWKAEKGTHIGVGGVDEKYYDEIFHAVAEDGIGVVYVVKTAEKPIAFSVLFNFLRSGYWFKTGFDRDYSKMSAGSMAIYFMIKDVILNRSADKMEFVSDYDYFSNWVRPKSRYVSYAFFSKSFQGRTLFMWHRTKKALKNILLSNRKFEK